MTEMLLQRTGILHEKNTGVLPSDFKNKLLPIVVYETALPKEKISWKVFVVAQRRKFNAVLVLKCKRFMEISKL